MFFLCWIRGWRREYGAVSDLAEQIRRLATRHEIAEWVSPGGLIADWELLTSDSLDEAAAIAQQRLKAVRELSGIMQPFKLGPLAEALARGGSNCALGVIWGSKPRI